MNPDCPHQIYIPGKRGSWCKYHRTKWWFESWYQISKDKTEWGEKANPKGRSGPEDHPSKERSRSEDTKMDDPLLETTQQKSTIYYMF